MSLLLSRRLCGYHPFDPDGDSSDNDMITNIKACHFGFDDADAWGNISENAKDLVRHLLVLDPADRYSMDQVLAHPWITGDQVPASEMPLSPTIHRDLAKFRENSKFKVREWEYSPRSSSGGRELTSLCLQLEFESFGYDEADSSSEDVASSQR